MSTPEDAFAKLLAYARDQAQQVLIDQLTYGIGFWEEPEGGLPRRVDPQEVLPPTAAWRRHQ